MKLSVSLLCNDVSYMNMISQLVFKYSFVGSDIVDIVLFMGYYTK